MSQILVAILPGRLDQVVNLLLVWCRRDGCKSQEDVTIGVVDTGGKFSVVDTGDAP